MKKARVSEPWEVSENAVWVGMSDPDFGRLTPGGKLVAGLLTVAFLAILSFCLRWVATTYGAGWLWAVIAVLLAIGFRIAFWLEARDRQRSRPTAEDPQERRY